MKMISRQLIVMFFFGLILSLLCAGCATTGLEKILPNGLEKIFPREKNVSPEIKKEDMSTEIKKEDMSTPAGYYIHIVKLPEESLSIIAKWFTGDIKNWEILAKHNPTINPDRIYIGDKIRIPLDLMLRKTPMTLDFVKASQPKPSVVQPPPVVEEKKTEEKVPEPETTPPNPPTEEELLFGPKGYTK